MVLGAQIFSPERDNCPRLGAINLILTRVLGLPQSIEIDERPDKKFRQGFLGALLQQQGARTKYRFPG